MGQRSYENPEHIVLEFEDGSEETCESLGIFEVDGAEYVALVPVNEDEDSVYLYGYVEHEDGSIELLDIEDDQFDHVSDVFESLVEEIE